MFVTLSLQLKTRNYINSIKVVENVETSFVRHLPFFLDATQLGLGKDHVLAHIVLPPET